MHFEDGSKIMREHYPDELFGNGETSEDIQLTNEWLSSVQDAFENTIDTLYINNNTCKPTTALWRRQDIDLMTKITKLLTGFIYSIRIQKTDFEQTKNNGLLIPGAINTTSPETLVSAVYTALNPNNTQIFNSGNQETPKIKIKYILAESNIIDGMTFLKNIDCDKYNATIKEKDPKITNGFYNIIERDKTLELLLQESRFDKTTVFSVIDRATNKLSHKIIITNAHSWWKVRKLTSLLTYLCPEVEGKIKATCPDFITALEQFGTASTDNREWMKTIIKISKLDIFNSKKIEDLIKDILNKSITKQTQDIETAINSIKSQIADYMQDIDRHYNTLTRYETDKLMLSKNPKVEENLKELLDFIAKTKLITRTKITSDGFLRLTINAPIRFYDKEYVKKIIKNKTAPSSKTNEKWSEILKMLDEVFIQEKYTLMTSTIADLIFYSEPSRPLKIIIRQQIESSLVYIGQPHLNGYSCLGAHETEIIKKSKEGDLLGAVSILLAATQNYNATDSAVLNKFVEYLIEYNYTKKTFKNNTTGELVSLADMQKVTETPTQTTEETPTLNTLGDPPTEETTLQPLDAPFTLRTLRADPVEETIFGAMGELGHPDPVGIPGTPGIPLTQEPIDEENEDNDEDEDEDEDEDNDEDNDEAFNF